MPSRQLSVPQQPPRPSSGWNSASPSGARATDPGRKNHRYPRCGCRRRDDRLRPRRRVVRRVPGNDRRDEEGSQDVAQRGGAEQEHTRDHGRTRLAPHHSEGNQTRERDQAHGPGVCGGEGVPATPEMRACAPPMANAPATSMASTNSLMTMSTRMPRRVAVARHGSDAERHDQDADRDQKKARAVELSGVPDGLPRIIGKGVVEEMVFGRNVVDCT